MSKILIVEDNDLNLKLFRDLLATKNHEVVSSSDGLNVIDIVLTEKPELILMDIQLNGVSGIDLIKELKADLETKHIPIIAITAFAMQQEKVNISKSGCDLYVSKPVSIDGFFGAIDKFIKPKETKAI